MTRETDKPKYGYTVGDEGHVGCPWCGKQLVLKPDGAVDGLPLKCPRCNKPLRMRVDRRITIRLYPVTAASEDSWANL